MAPGKQALAAAAYVGAVLCSLFAASSTETAVANGDTRTLSLYHSHTGESIEATFRVNGAYDPAVLEKLNWFLRDWRNNDHTKMDARLFDVIWEVYRTAGSTQPIVIFSAYRSPETNAMLRRRSHAVAEYSQHMLGKAMDTTMPGMQMERIREIGMRLQRGGVGYYPRENFVHLDVGNVRYWPRMGYDQLARIFPDGKSVDLAADGRALPRYEEARAEITARGGIASDAPTSSQQGGGGLLGWLFGNHDREEEAEATREPAPRARTTQVAALDKTVPDKTATKRGAAEAPKAPVAAPPPAASVAANPQRSEPEPAASVNKTIVASLDPASAHDKRSAPDDADGSTASLLRSKTFATLAPMPPSRPVDLVAYADIPTPPTRPDKLTQVAALTPQASPAAANVKPVARTDALGPLARAASLPVVITQGPKDQANLLPSTALAYAAGAQPTLRSSAADANAGQQSAKIVAARLDRSNFRELTSETPTASSPAESVLGQAVTGLRQAARIIPDALSTWPSAGYVAVFGAASNFLDSAHFTSRAAASNPAPGTITIVDAAPPPQGR
ncbi:MAG: DUF882 domain-containing protein [Methylocella sp.]